MSKQQARNVIRAVTATPWAILPEKLEAICELLELRAAGDRFTADEVRERLAAAVPAAELTDDSPQPRRVGSVAILPLIGTLAPRMNLMVETSGGTSTQKFSKQLDKALADDSIESIVIHVDSPGGSVLGTEELAAKIYAARGTKPILALAEGQMCSAAYYIASAADEVLATPSSLVGSIGVFLVHTERSEAAAAAGITSTVISAGKFKTDGNEFEPLSDQARATLQQRVDDYYTLFLEAVARNRGTTADAVRDGYGQARALLAERALTAGLVDRLTTLDSLLVELEGSGTSPPAPSARFSKASERMNTMDTKIKAALQARGLIESVDSSDEVATACLAAYFAGQGATCPTSDDAILAALTTASDEKHTPPEQASPPAPAAIAATAALPSGDAARQDERQRILDLQARGSLLGIGAESIASAIGDGLTLGAALETWTGELAHREQSLQAPKVTESAADRFNEAATDALLDRVGLAGGPLSGPARDLSRCSLAQIAETALQQSNQRIASRDPEAVAAQFLALGGQGNVPIATSTAAPGNYPNLLSNLAGKMLDNAMEIAGATYPEWTARMADVPDFKPKTIIGAGEFGLLPYHVDGKPFDDSDFSEQMAWIAADSYGDEFVQTPRMIVDDDIDGFTQALQQKGIAHELTLNQLAVDLITGNVNAPDGVALFHNGSHSNDITSGGAPSHANLDANRQKHRAQSGISGKLKLRTGPGVMLVPSALETDAEQLLLPGLSTVPIQDSSTNVFRGSVKPVVEQMLDDDSALKWYTFADPRILRAIVHVFQRGYGAGGQRRTYFDPSTNCRHWQIEGRFAVAVVNYQGTVRNAGA